MGNYFTKRESNFEEVAFVNHQMEFIRFYDNHYKINKEVAGFEEITLIEQGVEKKISIGLDNFWFAIKRVQAFVIDNIHYINRFDDRRKLLRVMNQIEEDFVTDSRFSYLLRKDERSGKEVIELNYIYFDYLIRCFKLVNILCLLLQPTLMVNTRALKKALAYRDESYFFINLGRYRNDLANDLANFKLINVIDHYKKVLGYYYTYKMLLVDSETFSLDPVVEDITSLINSKEVTDLLIYMRENNEYSDQMKTKMTYYVVSIKNILFAFYYLINNFLSERRVLPKTTTREVIDFTLI